MDFPKRKEGKTDFTGIQVFFDRCPPAHYNT
jgi:hypothetical protein